MQTFLPYKSFAESAACLDNKRLGKQRVEVLQILKALHNPSYGWQNHPAVKMCRIIFPISGQFVNPLPTKENQHEPQRYARHIATRESTSICKNCARFKYGSYVTWRANWLVRGSRNFCIAGTFESIRACSTQRLLLGAGTITTTNENLLDASSILH